MGNIIIILIYLSEYLAATFTEAFTQDRSLSSLKSLLPLHCWTRITLPVESVPRHQTLRALLPSIGYLQDPKACALLTVE